jgi:hypothetical protein
LGKGKKERRKGGVAEKPCINAYCISNSPGHVGLENLLYAISQCDCYKQRKGEGRELKFREEASN